LDRFLISAEVRGQPRDFEMRLREVEFDLDRFVEVVEGRLGAEGP
jgi:hypothetical protein